jgi:hypothetical protein
VAQKDKQKLPVDLFAFFPAVLVAEMSKADLTHFLLSKVTTKKDLPLFFVWLQKG